ncbi:BRO family protein [Holdemania massiliensis]|uniref:Phage repressor protein n=1 Tax=Holdemania massiliensis TaxID=1468449 RepID=A0A6N7S693_9FIRM|nr:BRO family protein [Holdemania massiliensis]MSA70963.1 phage repressor protein [Holdemania massiliensis]MSA89289.1 phage repressor protein [Holdemania massiliensis]MSB78042.1 phage repressor protein [Holdemania massiliensis]MSC32967.1 phage repressor protein [Holdemania massiliensis]MSC39364.1 phage repressor protein [Holdemania massiliensis]
MNDLRIYNFNSNEVRTLLIENEPWFVLKDVCDILELSNPTMVAGRLDGDEVTKFNLGGLSGESNIVNESGLYKVIFQSKKPEAKKFTKWVTSEVLPSIRKTGGYEVPKDPMAALKLMFEVQETDNKRINELEGKVSNLAENAPLTPSEYGYLNNLISSRVREVKQVHQMELNKQQYSYLYKAIGRDVKQVANVKVRCQIRSKDFNIVTEFVKDWEPSKATLAVIEQLKTYEN